MDNSVTGVKTLAEYDLSYQLSAGAIDAQAGIIKGATVAQAGVKALGKFVFLDKNGQLTRDEDEAERKIPVFTDEKTLDTLMAAAAEDGGVFKVRSDHNDALDARAGYAVNFIRDGNRVAADLKLNDSYRDRDIVLETAAKTPRLIGLSIDMAPSFEIVGTGDQTRALMRVEKLIAVDIVDGGAITHDGLFLQRKVDKTPTIKLATSMPDPKPTAPTIEECMARLSKLAEDVAAMQAGIAKMAAPVAPPAPDAELKASVSKLTEQMTTLADGFNQMKRTASSLGLPAGAGATPSVEEVAAEKERLRLKAEQDAAASKPKSYLQLVEAKKAEGKMSGAEAHRQVMKANPEAYREHLKARGVAA